MNRRVGTRAWKKWRRQPLPREKLRCPWQQGGLSKVQRVLGCLESAVTDYTLHCFQHIWLIGNMLWGSFEEHWYWQMLNDSRKKQFHTTWGARGCMEHVQAVTVLWGSVLPKPQMIVDQRSCKSSIVQVHSSLHHQVLTSKNAFSIGCKWEAGSKQVVED